MGIFEILAGSASIASLVFAAIVHHKQRVRRGIEEGNHRVVEERLRHIATSLRSGGTAVDLLIRRADSDGATAAELQNIARAVRASVYGALLQTQGMTDAVADWKFGEIVSTTDSSTHGREDHRDS